MTVGETLALAVQRAAEQGRPDVLERLLDGLVEINLTSEEDAGRRSPKEETT